MLFIVIFPLMFVSGIFVPTTGMPPVLRAIAEWNPLSSAATACRQLSGLVVDPVRHSRIVAARGMPPMSLNALHDQSPDDAPRPA